MAITKMQVFGWEQEPAQERPTGFGSTASGGVGSSMRGDSSNWPARGRRPVVDVTMLRDPPAQSDRELTSVARDWEASLPSAVR